MNVIRYVRFLTMALLTALAGCSSVTTDSPLSLEPKVVDKAKFEGTWILDKQAIAIQFASNGVAQLAGTEWKDDHFRLIRGEMIVTEGGQGNYLSIRFEEDGAWPTNYFFTRYGFSSQGELLVWLPSPAWFKTAVLTNDLTGVITTDKHSSKIAITNAAGVLLEYLERSDKGDCFDFEKPIILRKAGAD